MKFTPQQIRAIKMSPKGQLPKFIAGSYSDKNVSSVGGNIKYKKGNVGATIGIDRKKKSLFGSYNVNGKVKGSFGPQD